MALRQTLALIVLLALGASFRSAVLAALNRTAAAIANHVSFGDLESDSPYIGAGRWRIVCTSLCPHLRAPTEATSPPYHRPNNVAFAPQGLHEPRISIGTCERIRTTAFTNAMQICHTAVFTRSDLLGRHKRSCGQRTPRSRRKSCESCAESKIKCDLSLPCSRCVLRGRRCIFLNDPEESKLRKDKKRLRSASTSSTASTAPPSTPSPSTAASSPSFILPSSPSLSVLGLSCASSQSADQRALSWADSPEIQWTFPFPPVPADVDAEFRHLDSTGAPDALELQVLLALIDAFPLPPPVVPQEHPSAVAYPSEYCYINDAPGQDGDDTTLVNVNSLTTMLDYYDFRPEGKLNPNWWMPPQGFEFVHVHPQPIAGYYGTHIQTLQYGYL
ncbi:hypothetical protein MKEN_00641900 [Mycena kentingensis (nom. inval.)]|nr:hypothetical protein MKEN_00641900 [Mycena kentingensis (nom. inval.)]